MNQKEQTTLTKEKITSGKGNPLTETGEGLTIKSVVKAFHILDIITSHYKKEKEPLSLSRIAREAALQPSTARNLLKTMEKVHYIIRSADHLYFPGKGAFSPPDLSFTVSGAWLRNSSKILEEFAAQSGETVSLTTLHKGVRKVLFRFAGQNSVIADPRHAEPPPSPHLSPYKSLSGRILFLLCGEKARNEVLSLYGPPSLQEFPQWHSRSNFQLLRESLLGKEGVLTSENSARNLYSMGLPIELPPDVKKDLAQVPPPLPAALCVHIPAYRAMESTRKKVLTRLRECREELFI